MRHDVQQRAILLALATLLEMAEKATADPVPPCLHLRAILAFLVACGCEKRHCDNFWKTMTDATMGQSSATALGYMRQTYGRTHYQAIVRSLGIAHVCPDFAARVHRLRVTSDPDSRGRDKLAAMLRDEKHRREVTASKGHPRTEPARRWMERQIAEGKVIE